jgi:hypothetical protein
MDRTTIRPDFPFDVLGVIFEYYLDGESLTFSLETMLSVCRSWNRAALGHRKLWARLKIRIGHFPTSEIWKIRLPRRLERAGDSTPLEIDLRNIIGSPDATQDDQIMTKGCHRGIPDSYATVDCRCYDTAPRTVQELLAVLAGPNGELCHRWKSLYLRIGRIMLEKEMAYPTPNLEVAWLEQVSTRGLRSFLPSTPKLKTLEIRGWNKLAVSSLENVRNLTIRESDSQGRDFSIIKTAINVENLTIAISTGMWGSSTTYSFPNFPHLFSMSLLGDHLPSNLNEVQVPNIRQLSLGLRDAETLEIAVDSSLPFWQLQELELTCGIYYKMDEKWRATASKLVLACINLTRIKGDRKSLSVIVKLYWEKATTRRSGEKDIMGQDLSLWSIDAGKEVSVSRPESKSELEDAAMSLGLIAPSMNWDYMLQHV